jgi:Fe-S cluster assembly protein SufD
MSALTALRAAARAQAAALPAPSPALEDWRYVKTAVLDQVPPLQAGQPAAAAVPPAGPYLHLRDGQAQPGGTPWPAAWRLDLPDAATVARLQAALAEAGDATACWPLAEAGCVQHLQVAADAGVALTVLDEAVSGVAAWHLEIEVAANAALDLHLVHQASGAARSLPSLALRVAPGARVRVFQVQRGAPAQLLSRWTATVDRDARLEATLRGRGGALVRHLIAVRLAAPGAELDLAGLLTGSADEQVHLHTRVHHDASRTVSRQLVKTLLDGRAAASFDGCVAMAVGVQGGDAGMQNRNLLLSPTARADTRPQLDIRADDVKAAHGATVGRLDDDELLYLRLRGLDAQTASALLTTGYIAEVEQRLPEALR